MTTGYVMGESYVRNAPSLSYSGLRLGAALAWSWGWWALSVALGGTETLGGGLAWLVGGFGPALVVIATLRRESADYRTSFRHRLLDWRVAWGWWVGAAAFAILPKLVGLAVAALGGHTATGDSMALTALPGALLFGVLVVAIEEPLWRGVALDGFGPAVTKASLIIGVAWSAWHVPLFFIEGTFQNELGFATVDFAVFSLGIVGLSVVMTWLVVRSGGSILLAMFTHLLIVLNGEFFPDDTTIRVLEMCVIWSVAAIVLFRLQPWLAPAGPPAGAAALRRS